MSIKTKDFLNELNRGPLSFGQLLYSLRKSDEISQSGLAKKLGVSRGLICDIEKKRRTASIELAVKISKVLGYPREPLIKQLFDDQLRDAKIKLKVSIDAA
mgnify:CR=1 FL=1|jgi:transcriptional regulator with XRE-family HTH domain